MIKRGWDDKEINYKNRANICTEGDTKHLFVPKQLKFRE